MAGVELVLILFWILGFGKFFCEEDCEKTDAFRNLNYFISPR